MTSRPCPHGVVAGQCMACLALTIDAETTILPDLRHAPTQVPPLVLARVEQALSTLRAWNVAIEQARRMEDVAHQPGRYEYDLRYGEEAGLHAQRTRTVEAWRWLEHFARLAVTNGVDPDALYATLGGKPALVAEGAQVQAWRRADRP